MIAKHGEKITLNIILKFNNVSIGAVVVMIVRWLDLQLPVQSVPITTNVVRSNPAHCNVYSIQHYLIKFVRSCFAIL